jgi:vancomycin resistance protein YoaR
VYVFIPLAVLTTIGAAGGWWAAARWLPFTLPLAAFGRPAAALPGLRLAGEALSAREGIREQVERRARSYEQRRVRFVTTDGDVGTSKQVVLESRLGDLGVSVDVDEVTARILRLGRAEDVLTRVRLADRARHGRLDVPLEPRVDPTPIVERLYAIKEDLDEAPSPARLDLDRHEIRPERNGRALDVDAAAAAVAHALDSMEDVEILLPFTSVAPAVTHETLAHLDVSHVLASFATYFSRRGNQATRAHNIEVAASYIDGLVIGPGQVVSFNEVVGARSTDNGFAKSFEIFKGEYVEGMGGGTCQVASTLHAIAFFGGLEIVERLPHSRPSVYIQPGLDATVVYPTVDLKLRNPFSFPVVVHTVVEGNRLKMELLGADKPVAVSFGHDVLSTTPFDRKVVEEPGIAKPKRKQKGIDGMRLLRTRVLAYKGGRRKVESSRDTYPPTQEIWQVPPGYDEDELPPLGEDLPKPGQEKSPDTSKPDATAPRG